MRERLRVTFSLVGILLLFSLTAALVQVPMHPDTFFTVTMATIWFISSKFLVAQNIKTQQPKLTHNNILVCPCVQPVVRSSRPVSSAWWGSSLLATARCS